MNIDLLSKMVKELILDKNEVSLPCVGTFVSELVPSTFSDKGYTINPPYKKLSFRQKENIQDNSVIELYAKSNHIEMEAAEHIVKDFLEEMKELLIKRKVIIFPGLGKLRATKENYFFFVADEDLDIYPEGFGLEPVSMKTHEESISEVSETMASLRSILDPEEETAKNTPMSAQAENSVRIADYATAKTAQDETEHTQEEAAQKPSETGMTHSNAESAQADTASVQSKMEPNWTIMTQDAGIPHDIAENNTEKPSAEATPFTKETEQNQQETPLAEKHTSHVQNTSQQNAPHQNDTEQTQDNTSESGTPLTQRNTEQTQSEPANIQEQAQSSATNESAEKIQPQSGNMLSAIDGGQRQNEIEQEQNKAGRNAEQPQTETSQSGTVLPQDGTAPENVEDGSTDQHAETETETSQAQSMAAQTQTETPSAQNTTTQTSTEVQSQARITALTSDNPSEAQDKTRYTVYKTIKWTLIALIILAVLALAAFMILARTSPDFIDSILYTPEDLEVIRY